MWSVVVGNVGAVYEGSDKLTACECFEEYSALSRNGVGRASGEAVTLFKDGEIVEETAGTEWTVEVGNVIVGYFKDEAEAIGLFEEYCELEPNETITLCKNGVMDDQRDPLPFGEEEESEDEDCE